MLIQLALSPLHIALLHFFVVYCEAGLLGIAIACSITGLALFGLTFAYARFCIPEMRKSFIESKEYSMWSSWPAYLKLGTAGAIFEAILSWSVRGIVIGSAFFGEEA